MIRNIKEQRKKEIKKEPKSIIFHQGRVFTDHIILLIESF